MRRLRTVGLLRGLEKRVQWLSVAVGRRLTQTRLSNSTEPDEARNAKTHGGDFRRKPEPPEVRQQIRPRNLDQGYEVYPVNPHAEEIESLKAYPSLADLPVSTVDRVSVYLPPAVGVTLLEEIQALEPAEVWFNPGSESDEILDRAQELGLRIIMACSIVDLGVSPSQFPG